MKKVLLVMLLPVFFVFQFCGGSKKTIVTKPVSPTGKITFDDNVKPLVSAKCAPCHTGGLKKKLTSFDNAKESIDDIIRRTHLEPGEKDFMPHKRDKLPDSLLNVFVRWKNEGLLEH